MSLPHSEGFLCHTTTDLKVLIDLGADENLMYWGLAAKIGLKSEPVTQPIKTSPLNGQALFTITHLTEPLTLYTYRHQELINFYLVKSPSPTLILENPWL